MFLPLRTAEAGAGGADAPVGALIRRAPGGGRKRGPGVVGCTRGAATVGRSAPRRNRRFSARAHRLVAPERGGRATRQEGVVPVVPEGGDWPETTLSRSPGSPAQAIAGRVPLPKLGEKGYFGSMTCEQ